MSRAMRMAVAFVLARAMVQANQCSSGSECPSHGKPEYAVSLLQTKLQMNVLEGKSGETISKLLMQDKDAIASLAKDVVERSPSDEMTINGAGPSPIRAFMKVASVGKQLDGPSVITQTPVKTVLQQYEVSKEVSKEGPASAAKEDTNEAGELVRVMHKKLSLSNETVHIDSSVSNSTCDFGSTKYALFIDGKDNGTRLAYGHGFITRVEGAWKYAQETLGTKITEQYLKSLHEKAFPENKSKYRPTKQHMNGRLSCLSLADENLKEELLVDLPLNILDVNRNPNGSIHTILQKGFGEPELKKHLAEIALQYNNDQQEAGDAPHQLRNLAKFLRSLAWLHPFTNGNGRLRNLILQRELRRLQLGCGAMMFNNNADIYFESSMVFVKKILEGIAVAKHALKHRQNPWHDAAFVHAHLRAFPLHSSLAECRRRSLAAHPEEKKDILYSSQ